ncbi:MAG: type I restriction-modification system subunit M N-terminal domain-containing protein [Segetibacter sp.]
MTIKELEKTLWATAKKLRNNTDAVTHMHIVLGLIFLRYITEAFNTAHENVIKSESNSAVPDSVGSEKSLSHNSFYLSEKTQWAFLQSNANKPDIGALVDDAVVTIEKNK